MKHLTLLLFLAFSTVSLAQTQVVALDDVCNHIGETVTVCDEVKSTIKTKEHKHEVYRNVTIKSFKKIIYLQIEELNIIKH